MWYTHILQCSDGTFYVGNTDDLTQRLDRHNNGRAAKWTTTRLPVRLVYHERHNDRSDADARERQIKKWSRSKKEALIAHDTELLKRLRKSKDQPV